MPANLALRTPPLVSGALPGLGHALEFHRDREGLARRGFEEHGDVFAVQLGPKRLAMVIGPEHTKTFFAETDRKLDQQAVYGFLRAMFGEVLFLAPPEEYQRQRPFMKELLSREKMPRYVELIEEVVQRWIDGLDDRGEFEVTEVMTHLVQQAAAACFLGPEVQARIGEEFWELYEDLSNALDPLLPPNLPHPKFLRRDRAKVKLTELLRPIIAERRAHPEQYDDFLQDLVTAEFRDGELVDEERLRNLLVGLVFASHETTIGQAAWSLILLLQHEEYLGKVQAELDAEAPHPTPFDLGVLSRLPHLAWTVKEVERIRPSIDLLMRLVVEDIEFGDHVIPEGWLVEVVQVVSHRLPGLFDRPEAFDPLRFGPGREEDKQHRFSTFGFGGGIHKCPGMTFANSEMVIIVALLLRQLDLELLTPDPQVVSTLGANRASPATVRYRRRT
ncbi:MAG: cytochrome P450 [Actinomycetota bacterium]|nr:cytochrome P450 [Actinomycetota bacterium]